MPAHNRLPESEGSFNGLVTRYRLSAVDRGITFDLTREEFRGLTQQDCHFCGALPSQIAARGSPKGAAPLYVYNGIDRIDSSLGYENGNVLPCCGICNRMKGEMSIEDFFARVRAIHNRSTDRAPGSGHRTFMP